jgi:predicted GNAT superfamily acetyltransferase
VDALTDTAWDLALAAAERSAVSLVPLPTLGDLDRVREVVARVWGEQPVPREMLRALQHAGCVLCGAESDGELVGFVFGFLGSARGLHVHSHMLAALPQWQDRGVGYALKLAQRAMCLEQGIDEVRWTFDPLVARNARFNLAKLGAVAVRFLPGFYGEMIDRLNRDDRTDRFEVRWLLRSNRVRRALDGDPERPAEGGPVVLDVAGPAAAPEPRPTGRAPEPGARVRIPADHFALRLRDAELGTRWREESARAIRACLGLGLAGTWFDREGYAFEPPPDGLSVREDAG